MMLHKGAFRNIGIFDFAVQRRNQTATDGTIHLFLIFGFGRDGGVKAFGPVSRNRGLSDWLECFWGFARHTQPEGGWFGK